MTKMIRCIEGHVFDVDKQNKCPECGWVPVEKKAKPVPSQNASPLAFVGAFFGALIGAVEKLLGMVGLRDKPGLAAGIVYACVILLCVGGASALTGVFRGNGNAPAATPPATVNVPPPELQKTTPPQQKQQAPSESRQRNTNTEPPPSHEQPSQQPQQTTPPQQQAPNQYQQRPHIHVPGEVRQLLRRIF